MTPPPSAPRRFLALWFPYLATDRLVATGAAPAPADAPFVVVRRERGALRVAAPSPEAARLGLHAGLPLADARARVPGLAVAHEDADADRAWLGRVADACDRYTPSVALDGTDGVVMDVTGALHHWGGEAGLLADARARLRALRLRHGAGGSPEAARALARHGTGGEALEPLPVVALGLSPEATTALRRAGLATVGDLASRPTGPLAARFGAEAVVALRRLLGQEDSRIVPRRLPPPLVATRRFAEPLLLLDSALAVLADLAAEAGREMEIRGQGGRRFELRLFRSDGAVRDVGVTAGRPIRDPPAVLRLFGERLEALSDPIDPGFGFDVLRLAVPVLEPLAPRQMGLEGRTDPDADLQGLLDRLDARLGPGRVRRFAPAGSHVPEREARPVTPGARTAPWPRPRPGEPPSRPLHLLDPPQRIDVLAEVPDGPPRRFTWRRTAHEVVRHEGPERIGPEWWRLEAPGRLTRDYWRLEDARGRRFWVFRHGLYGAERATPRWYVHGLFA